MHVTEVVSRRRRGRVSWKLAIRLSFAAAAVVFSVYALATRWTQVRADLASLDAARVAGSASLLFVALLCGMLSWRAVVSSLGSPLGRRDGARIYFVGQLGKYLPGSIWPMVTQMELGKDCGIPRRRSLAALLSAILISLATAIILAGVTIPFFTDHKHQALRWLILGIPFALALLHPRVLRAILLRVPFLKLNEAFDDAFVTRGVLHAVLWATAGWVCYGLHVVILASAFPGAAGGTLLAASIGGYALAWSAGMVAFVLPAGAGARDAALVFVLSTQLSPSAALAVAVVSRALSTFCDLSWAGIASLGAWSRLRAAARRGQALEVESATVDDPFTGSSDESLPEAVSTERTSKPPAASRR